LVRNVQFMNRRALRSTPIPGYWARLLVSGTADIPAFLELGRQGFECIREALHAAGIAIDDLDAVLDFGCGCGRVTRHWNCTAGPRIYGTDINEYLVKVGQRCVPAAIITRNALAASLDYSDEMFDLIYAFSVFTHLDVDAQQKWRDELRRVLKPGGILILSVHGSAYKGRLAEEELAAFDEGHAVVRLAAHPGGNLCVCFHPESYVREKLADGFDVIQFVPQGAKGNPVQDLYVLRRTD
jgi:SAM-dependent methyltransferase